MLLGALSVRGHMYYYYNIAFKTFGTLLAEEAQVHQEQAGLFRSAAGSVRIAGVAAAGAGCGRRLESRRRGRAFGGACGPARLGPAGEQVDVHKVSLAVIHAEGPDAVPCTAADVPPPPSHKRLDTPTCTMEALRCCSAAFWEGWVSGK